MFTRRYHVQSVDLDTVVRKSQINWLTFSKSWSLKKAMETASRAERENVIAERNHFVRVLDTKTGRPVA